MKLLILGGTVFLGRSLVNAAIQSGHEVTLFNRGISNPDLFPEVENIKGDRKLDLSALRGRAWDVVVDTCGYVPRVVGISAQLLSSMVERYVFISSLSVYSDLSQLQIDESSPVSKIENTEIEEVTGETYGPLKALCEQVVQDYFSGRALILRPGLIVGPNDPSDRFTYWPCRIAHGGKVLAPGRPERTIQFIDVRDLAEWIIRVIENKTTGTFNADGPRQPIPFGKVLTACREITRSEAEIIWTSEPFLIEHNVGPWIELPLWIPETDSANSGFYAISIEKALSEGLRFRPVEETIRETYEWAITRPADHPWRAGLNLDKEADLLTAWEKVRL